MLDESWNDVGSFSGNVQHNFHPTFFFFNSFFSNKIWRQQRTRYSLSFCQNFFIFLILSFSVCYDLFRKNTFDSISNAVILFQILDGTWLNESNTIQHKNREKKGINVGQNVWWWSNSHPRFFSFFQHNFSSFSIFALEQTIPTFHPTEIKWYVG